MSTCEFLKAETKAACRGLNTGSCLMAAGLQCASRVRKAHPALRHSLSVLQNGCCFY